MLCFVLMDGKPPQIRCCDCLLEERFDDKTMICVACGAQYEASDLSDFFISSIRGLEALAAEILTGISAESVSAAP